MSSMQKQQPSLLPKGGFRWILTALGAWCLVATAIEDTLRYQRVVEVVLALIVVAAGVTSAEYRAHVRKVVLGVASVFLALAGVVAAASISEGMTLVAGAIIAGALSCLFTGLPRRPRHLAASA